MVKRIALFGFHKISQIYRTSLFILKIGLNIIFQFSFQVTRKITGLCYNSTLETCKPVVSSIIRCIIRPDIFVLILLKCRSWNYLPIEQAADIFLRHLQITIYRGIKFLFIWPVPEHSLLQPFKHTRCNQCRDFRIRDFNLCSSHRQIFIAGRIRCSCFQRSHISLDVTVHLCHCCISAASTAGFSGHIGKNIFCNGTEDFLITKLMAMNIGSIQQMTEIKWHGELIQLIARKFLVIAFQMFTGIHPVIQLFQAGKTVGSQR